MFAYGLNNFVNLVDPTGFAAEEGAGFSVTGRTYSGLNNIFGTNTSVFANRIYDTQEVGSSTASGDNEPLIYQAPIQSGFWSAVGSGIDYNLKNIEPTTATKYVLKGVGSAGATGIGLDVLTDYSFYKAGKNESFSLINSTINSVLDGVVSGLAIAGATAIFVATLPITGTTAIALATGAVILGGIYAEYNYNFKPSGYIRRKLDF